MQRRTLPRHRLRRSGLQRCPGTTPLSATGAWLLALALGWGPWLQPARAQVLNTDASGSGSGELRRGPLRVTLRHIRQAETDGTASLQPEATVRLNDAVVGRLKGAGLVGLTRPAAVLQIAEMDPANPYPEVLLSSFTGGAHCCNDLRVLTSDRSGRRWRTVTLGPFNGVTSTATDPIGSGRSVLVDVDNRFLYQFASYAGSAAPSRIWQLNGDRFLDVSHDPAYRPVHRRQLNRWAAWFREPDPGEANGFLAAYVATKTLLGEGAAGWRLMLSRYDRRSDWGLKECRAGYDDAGRCKAPEIVHASFPDALRAFLIETGYRSASGR